MKVELFASDDGMDIIARQDDNYRKISENDSLVHLIDDIINHKYPIAAKRLDIIYKIQFDKVLRFCKCNFSINDKVPDIEGDNFIFEFVHCPMRGECPEENLICNPTLSTGLTVRETEVVKELAKGKMAKEVAISLRITPRTAEVHKRNIYAKLGCGTVGELVNWAHANSLA